MIRIIAGSARGRAIKTPPFDPSVRPILGRIKKSLFDILNPIISESRFLDLYAGYGAVGLEALSRGASHVCFIEQDNGGVKLIKENLDFLGFQDKADIRPQNVLGNLTGLGEPFDIIFMGPPYKDKNKIMLNLTLPTLENIQKHQLLNPGGIVISQHHKREVIKPLPDKWTLKREKIYGDSFLSFFELTTINP